MRLGRISCKSSEVVISLFGRDTRSASGEATCASCKINPKLDPAGSAGGMEALSRNSGSAIGSERDCVLNLSQQLMLLLFLEVLLPCQERERLGANGISEK